MIINSIQVIGGPTYTVGGMIQDIIEKDGVLYLYDKDDRLKLEIRGCAVVIGYKVGGES